MSDVKFTLLTPNSHYAIGVIDMKCHINHPLSAAGCTLLICNQGRAVVSINFRKLALKPGDVVFLFSDMVFIILETSRNFTAFHCTVSAELFNEANYNTPWDFYEYLYRHPVCATTAEQYTQLVLWQQQVSWFATETGLGQQYSFMRNSIQNLFLGVDREIKRNPDILKQTQRKDRAWTLLNQFYNLLSAYGQENRSVGFYADKLHITPYYLYKITHKIMKLSPKELIDEQIVVEIKMHLTCTNLSIKQIAEKLCFEDPSYMCRFFRRHTGKALTEYQTEFI